MALKFLLVDTKGKTIRVIHMHDVVRRRGNCLTAIIVKETEQPSAGIEIKFLRPTSREMGKRIMGQVVEGSRGNDVISPWSTVYEAASNDIPGVREILIGLTR